MVSFTRKQFEKWYGNPISDDLWAYLQSNFTKLPEEVKKKELAKHNRKRK
jgi:hypothetical protein